MKSEQLARCDSTAIDMALYQIWEFSHLSIRQGKESAAWRRVDLGPA
jgi:hypothetical protein